MLRQLLPFLCAFVFVVECFGQSKVGNFHNSGDWLYLHNGEWATIAGYTGASSSVDIPEELDGYPVRILGGTDYGPIFGRDNATIFNVSIPDGVMRIGESAFSGCKELRVVLGGSGVLIIDSFAFYRCSNLWYFELGDKLKTIGDSAFYSCSSLGSTGDLVLPQSLTKIGDLAFAFCTSLKVLKIPGRVTHIGSSAFFACDRLKEIVLPESIMQMGEGAFGKIRDRLYINAPDRLVKEIFNDITEQGSSGDLCFDSRIVRLHQQRAYLLSIFAGAIGLCVGFVVSWLPKRRGAVSQD